MSKLTLLDKFKMNKFVACTLPVWYSPFLTEEINLRGSILIATIGTVAAIATVKKQVDRARRLLNDINEKGYDDRLCNPLMNKPCDRSLVKTVLKRTGNYEHYLDLKENNSLDILF